MNKSNWKEHSNARADELKRQSTNICEEQEMSPKKRGQQTEKINLGEGGRGWEEKEKDKKRKRERKERK